MPRIRLGDIMRTEDRAAVMGLRLAPGQENYLNSMEEIFEEARIGARCPTPGRSTTPIPARSSAS